MKKVRTRFAPSPTGFMHIGNLRTALYSYLYAKKEHGDFILRIEDTDEQRHVEGSENVIYKSLKESGLMYTEGPDVGGNYGPYVQSERKDVYKKYINELLQKRKAYRCFCSKERLVQMKEEQQAKKIAYKYDGFCKKLSEAEIEKKLADKESYVVRQDIPQDMTIEWNDAVYGALKVNSNELDQSVLMKSDGMPTYNFANVVDDHLMEISHVIRGAEYITSTPKYILLYQAFGWDIPEHVHLPAVMKNAKQKLSKREGDASFQDLMERGFLKEAIINYIALLGWNPKTEREIFTLQELENIFELAGLHKAPAIFDIEKLKWMNQQYILKMPLETFHALAEKYYKQVIHKPNIDFKLISKTIQNRTSNLSEIPDMIDFIEQLPDYSKEMYVHKKMKTTLEIALNVLQQTKGVLKALTEWNEETLHNAIFDFIKKSQLKNGQVLWPIRTALSGKAFTPGGAIEIASILGKEESLRRIEQGIQKLIS